MSVWSRLLARLSALPPRRADALAGAVVAAAGLAEAAWATRDHAADTAALGVAGALLIGLVVALLPRGRSPPPSSRSRP